MSTIEHRPDELDKLLAEWEENPPGRDGATTEAPDPALAQLIQKTWELDEDAAAAMAARLAPTVKSREEDHFIRQFVAIREAAKDQRLDALRFVTAAEFLAEEDEKVEHLLGELVAEGHNATITAAYKAGKTTLIENAIGALVTGRKFLARFQVPGPKRVALLNFELTPADQRKRLQALELSTEAAERLMVVNLRGHRLSLTTPSAADLLVEKLAAHQADVLIVDTYGAAVASSVESENDNAAVRRFLNALDDIKARAGVSSLLMTAHTGRGVAEDGSEHARGATVIDDWADVRIILTKDRTSGVRYLSSEGRSEFDLPESALRFEPSTRGLWLPDANVGVSKAAQRAEYAVELAKKAIRAQPGIIGTDLRRVLREAGVTNNDAQTDAKNRALDEGSIHTHQEGTRVRHFPGPTHGESDQCWS